MAEEVQLLSLSLPCDRHAPAAVRHALGNAGADCERLEDGLLVASELVTNAVLHSGCVTGHRIEVSASVSADGLLISVHDPGLTKQDATPREPAPFGGWGLRIVDELARRWGTERPDGYRVWAELALSS